VAGKGIERLRNANIAVTVGVLEDECRKHHKRFFTVQEKKRPYIILKWAETKDGFVAPLSKFENKPVFISNSYSQQLVHKLRSKEQAILVGINTVLADNPKLNVRSWSGENPIRVVLDSRFRTPKNLNILDGSVKTIFITAVGIKQQELSKNVIFEEINFSKNIAKQVCEVLYKHSIQSLIVEGGPQTLQTFINENLWDEALIFEGDTVFLEGVKAPIIEKKNTIENIKNDVLKIHKND
jgi:diaminohydroxyphosphoribosylaminopyrimidine deaminase/5-amino-6-(5-phosphoribosylamino)uracil reductase